MSNYGENPNVDYNSEFCIYRSPFTTRYASKQMLFNFSDQKKFSTWRKMWYNLAKAQQLYDVGKWSSTEGLQMWIEGQNEIQGPIVQNALYSKTNYSALNYRYR